MKKAILVAIIGAMTLGVNAGDWGKAPVAVDKTPIEECYDIGGEISAGYMSDYIFYGQRISRDSVWTDVNYTFDNLALPVTIGAWYLNSINNNNGTPSLLDELDLYVSVGLGTIAGFDVSVGYVHYFFPESGNVPPTSYGEIGLDLSRSLGFADLILETNYGLDAGGVGAFGHGWYHQAGLEKTIGLTDAVSLVVGAGVGYSDSYFGNGPGWSDWNHYYATASLPIELNCRATLTPYVGYNGSPSGYIQNDLLGQDDILHGGVSLTVSF